MLPLILAMGTAHADIPLGTPIGDAAAIDITTKGMDTLLDVAATQIPERIVLSDVVGGDSCATMFLGQCVFYDYELGDTPAGKELWVEVELDQLSLIPGPNNTLALDGVATVRVNDAADPAHVYLSAGYDLGFLGDITISDTCDAYIRDFQVVLSADVGAVLGTRPTGEKFVDFTIGTPTIDYTLTESNVEITGSSCDVDNINDVADFLGFNLIELLLDQVEPLVDDLVATLPQQVEPELENAIPSLTFIDTFDVLGVPLDIQIEPDDLNIDNGGLRISMLSRIEAPVASCVEPFLVDMVDTPSQLPAIGDTPSSVGFAPDIAAAVDDDFVNQALYAIWAGGVLCINDDLDLGLPVPLSSLLGGLLPQDEYEDIFDLDTLEVAFTPTQPPRFSAQGDADVNITLDGMGIGFNAQLEGRKVRVANVNLSMDLGTDVAFDGNTGELAVAIDLLGADIGSEVDFNEYVPEATPLIEEQVPAVIQSLFPFITPLLDDLVFPLPSFEGFGVTAIDVAPAGPDRDRLGLYAGAGPVVYQSKGCEDGCSSSGCNSGPGGAALITFPLMFVALRRRRSA